MADARTALSTGVSAPATLLTKCLPEETNGDLDRAAPTFSGRAIPSSALGVFVKGGRVSYEANAYGNPAGVLGCPWLAPAALLTKCLPQREVR
jgi:hypothetical protein